MMTRSHRLSFLKVLAAVAWADGIVEEDERNRIKVLFNAFDLDPAHRKELESLLDRPVTFARALELTKEFAGLLAPPGSRRRLLEEIESMLGAGADRSPEEVELLEHVKSILSSHTVVDGLVEKLRGVFSRTLLSRRERPERAGRLTEYARNSALHRVRDLFREKGWSLEQDPAEWNRVTLLGVLLAHVAHVEGGWRTAERDVVGKILARSLPVDDRAREVLLTVMEEERDRDTDLQRICVEYCRVSTMEERLDILDSLLAVAAASGSVSKREAELVRRIADFLWISNPEYLAVRDRYRDRIEK